MRVIWRSLRVMEEKRRELLEDEEITYLRAWDVYVIQKKGGYRFSLDSLILAGIVDLGSYREVLDLGAGSGVISLILAKRFPNLKVFAVEVQEGMVDRLRRSISLNKLEGRIEVIHSSFRDLKSLFRVGSFSAVISNPPYWPKDFAKNKDMTEEELIARYEILTDIEEFVDVSSYLLRNKGKLFMVYPTQRLVTLMYALRSRRIEPKRLVFIHPDRNKRSEFMYLECTKGGKESLTVESPIFVYSDSKRGLYTREVADMIGVRDELVDKDS